jgi:lipoprotein-anchoring transpeptidase ErfK/SrfK
VSVRKSIPVMTDEAVLPRPALLAAVSAVRAMTSAGIEVGFHHEPTVTGPPPRHHFLSLPRRYNIALFALLFLAVGTTGIEVGGSYWSRHVLARAQPLTPAKLIKPTITGLNLTVPAAQLQAKLQAITGQPATLTVGGRTVPVGADTIKGWLQITTNQAKTEDYIRIKAGAMTSSLTAAANQFAKAPVNAVTVSEDGTDVVVVGGRNGVALADPSGLKAQADQAAKIVMDGKGLAFNGGGLTPQPFQSITPAAFDKLLVANVTSKKMWAFQNGQEVNSWLVSAGKPTTPTPLGEFHVYAKFTVQDMRGSNPDGTPYFQPAVPWVNYFYQGSAVHGVYWHPLSWFGAINSSHGCVGLPVDEAHWVYNWAPIGTTVITHA